MKIVVQAQAALPTGLLCTTIFTTAGRQPPDPDGSHLTVAVVAGIGFDPT
ncbi:MAG TPA: hypothetical protein VFH02_07185 [Jiangellaceae bacterium]|nr:hypothetical protein [Jiangellaceae bacterium]